jgi:protein SCO1/2
MKHVWSVLIVVSIGVAGMAWWTGLVRPLHQGNVETDALEELPLFGMIPPFTLLERARRPLRLEDLHGKVWVANFMYTSCPDFCPLQSAEMAKLQAEFAAYADMRLVSITVDPKHDTPEVLSRYAARFQADPDRWFFATGDPHAIAQLARGGFRLGAAASALSDSEGPTTLVHSNRFTLIDRQARIRGYYQSTEADDLQRLRRDLTTLLRQVASST